MILRQHRDCWISDQIGKVATNVKQDSRVSMLYPEIDLHCNLAVAIVNVEVIELLKKGWGLGRTDQGMNRRVRKLLRLIDADRTRDRDECVRRIF